MHCSRNAGRSEKVFDLDSIKLGFIRPQEARDWTIAYCQAEMYVDYVLATYGADATGRMLAAYGKHLSTPDVLQTCFGVRRQSSRRIYASFCKRSSRQKR